MSIGRRCSQLSFAVALKAVIVALCLSVLSVPALRAKDANYRLSANDMLDFRVFQEP